MKLNKITMVHHHVCYEEIHGYELVILMPFDEHVKLHRRLRKDSKCNIPVDELKVISTVSKSNRKINNIRSKKKKKKNIINIYTINLFVYLKVIISVYK